MLNEWPAVSAVRHCQPSNHRQTCTCHYMGQITSSLTTCELQLTEKALLPLCQICDDDPGLDLGNISVSMLNKCDQNKIKMLYQGADNIWWFHQVQNTLCEKWLILTYMLSRTVSKLLQICAFDRGVPLFDTFVWGEPLNAGLRNLASRNYKHCSIVWC